MEQPNRWINDATFQPAHRHISLLPFTRHWSPVNRDGHKITTQQSTTAHRNPKTNKLQYNLSVFEYFTRNLKSERSRTRSNRCRTVVASKLLFRPGELARITFCTLAISPGTITSLLPCQHGNQPRMTPMPRIKQIDHKSSARLLN